MLFNRQTYEAVMISTTAIDHSFINQLTQWVTNWAFTFHVQSSNLQLPFPTSCSILPAAIELPQLANTIRVATISTTTIDYWFFNLHTQPALKTASATRYTSCIDYTFHNSCCNSHCHYVQFSTLPLTTRYTTAFTIRVAFPTAIELLQLPLVDNYTPACTTLQNIFHHHQLLNLQVVLSSLLQLASTTRYMSGHLQ